MINQGHQADMSKDRDSVPQNWTPTPVAEHPRSSAGPRSLSEPGAVQLPYATGAEMFTNIYPTQNQPVMYRMGPPVDSVQLVYKWLNYGVW